MKTELMQGLFSLQFFNIFTQSLHISMHSGRTNTEYANACKVMTAAVLESGVGVSCCSSLFFHYRINRHALWRCTRSNSRTWIGRPLFVPIVLSGTVYRDILRASIMFGLSNKICLKF